jgi:hypothetical protein
MIMMIWMLKGEAYIRPYSPHFVTFKWKCLVKFYDLSCYKLTCIANNLSQDSCLMTFMFLLQNVEWQK